MSKKITGVRIRNLRQASNTVPHTQSKRPPKSQAKVSPKNSGENLQPSLDKKKAQRNADAYTAFVTLSALSTTLFLAGTGGTVYFGLKYGKAEGTYQLMKEASKGSDQFFTETGELTSDAKQMAKHVPGLMGALNTIQGRADAENMSIQEAIDETKASAKQDRKKYRNLTKGIGIAAGVGLVGMIVFISAAKITKHRGLMLFGPHRKGKARAQLQPSLSPQNLGAAIKVNW